jgi:DoxX-like family
MAPDTRTASVPKALLWTGRIISALPVLALLASATMKLLSPASIVEDFTTKFGYPESVILPIGLVEIICTLLYVIPQTSVLGAILLTGYLGGAVATHVRADDGQFAVAAVMGVLVWLGLLLRERRLWTLLPFRI